MDIITPQQRSALMARIKAKDTKPELLVRKMAFALGRRYRLHVNSLPGRPDLVFPRDRKLIFVHGCFWHQHSGCPIARPPSSRLSYWIPKLNGNRQRDRTNARRLRRAGWSLLTIRECELREIERVRRRITEFLQDRSPGAPRQRASRRLGRALVS